MFTAQTPQSKSKLRFDLLNSNLAKKQNVAPLSRLNVHNKKLKQRRILTPHHKHSSSSNKKIEFGFDKSKKGARQIQSSTKEQDGLAENPRNLMEIRKKLNLTGGYTDGISLNKLRNYGTNNSAQSQARNRQVKAQEVRPGLGAFLKHPKQRKQVRVDEHPQNVKLNNFLRGGRMTTELSTGSAKKSQPRKNARKEQLRKQLFNQNVSNSSRLGAQKMLSMRGIKGRLGRKGDKFTSSRNVKPQKLLNYENFQSQRGNPGRKLGAGRVDSEKKFNSNKFEERFQEENLETREDMERLADYIAEKADHRGLLTPTDGGRKSGSLSAQISPKLVNKEKNFFPSKKWGKGEDMGRESATFDLCKKKISQDNFKNKASTAINFKQKLSYSIEPERRKMEKKHRTDEGTRKDNTNIYDMQRARKGQNSETKMKVYDSNGKIYMVSRTVLTEEAEALDSKAHRGSVTSLQMNNRHASNLELYANRPEPNHFKMSGFLRDHIRKTSNYELDQSHNKEIRTSDLDSYAQETLEEAEEILDRVEEPSEEVQSRPKRKKSAWGHRRSKTGAGKEHLGSLLLSDENGEKEGKCIVIQNLDKRRPKKAKKFEILDDDKAKMTFTNKRNVKGKVFDLFSKESGDSNPDKTEEKVNVSKKYDSGTDFFIHSERHAKKSRKRPRGNEQRVFVLEAQNQRHFDKKIKETEDVFSGKMSERELQVIEKNLYQKPTDEVDSERNLLYHRLNASELKVKRGKDKKDWLNSKVHTQREKIEMNTKGSYSVRVMEDLKNFKEQYKLPQEKRGKAKGEQETREEADKKRRVQLKKKREAERGRKKRGHKRNVHSEQLTDYFRDIVKKNNYPIEVKQTYQNMTPDISRNNSLNASFDATNIPAKVKLSESGDQVEESQANPFRGGTGQSKHIQISYENIRSSSQLTNVNQLITPKNNKLKSSFNLDPSRKTEEDSVRGETSKTIDKQTGRKEDAQPKGFPGTLGEEESGRRSLASDSSASSFKIVELKRRRKLRKMEKKLIDSKSVFLEDNDQHKYGSNRGPKRQINFMNPEDESDLHFIKHKFSERADVEPFRQRNKDEIRLFLESNAQMTPKKSLNSDVRVLSRPSRRRDSAKSQEQVLPMQTQEMVPQKRETPARQQSKRNSRASDKRVAEARNSSQNGSLSNPSFAQGSRNSRISITVTQKSSKNSEANNFVISHSLQNSGIHSKNRSQPNVFKIESPEVHSGSPSPKHEVQIEMEESPLVHPLEQNLDDLRTMNKKNMTFNPNDQSDPNPVESPVDGACLDVAIPRIRSSFEDSLASFHSDEFVKEPSPDQQITENTFGYGMEAVIKQAKPKNVFTDSLSSFGPVKSKNTPSGKGLNLDYSEPKSVSQNSLNMSRKAKPKSGHNHTEFYYERENIGNGDSSYKFSNSDNSSRLKNVTPTSHSRDYIRSSNPESTELGPRRRSKFMRDVLRGKLNSPVRRIRELSEEKEAVEQEQPEERNDNRVRVDQPKRQEHMRNSELVSLKKKSSQRKRTQIYDNKSAMMKLERSKKTSENNSPVRKEESRKGTNESKRQSKGGRSKLYKQKKQVLVMKSKGARTGRKHMDFVNVSQENSTLEDKKGDTKASNSRKRRQTLSREASNQNSISRQTSKKQATVDKKKRKKAPAKVRKGAKKRKKDAIKSRGSHTESAQRNKKQVSKSASQAKDPKKEKSKKARARGKNADKKKKHGSILDTKQMKRVLEMKIMKYSTLGKVIDTSLEFYDLKRMLGEGSYAKVHLGVSALCGKKVAIKLYEKAKIKTRSSSERIFTEIGILRRMNHRNIVNFIEIFQNPKYIFIVLEYANGGDLLNYLKTKGKFKEHEYRKILQQIIDALEYIHEHRILHRDIKLDNVLLTKSGLVKICDFGISRKMYRNDPVFEHIGTPAYIAPEIVKEKGYSGFGADIWSLGVMTYMALTGNVPFKGNTIEELHQSILKKEVTFSEKTNLSAPMKKAIRGMLVKDPRRRMTLKDICKILDLRPTLNQKKEKNFADEEIVTEIKSYGYPEKMIKESLKNDMINHITALYKLHKN